MDEDAPHITIVTEYFYPEEASTAQLLTSLATGLQGDFEVSVLTGRPNYHPGDETELVSAREQHNGVSIERLPATRLDKDTLPFRVVNWITFTLLVFWQLVRTHDSDDVVLVLSNPPLLPLATSAAKRLCGISYGYLIYDMYPDFPVALDMISEESIVAQWWERVMRMIYRDADQIVVLGDSMKRRLTSKMDDDPVFSPTKVEVIPNWEDGDFIEPMPKSKNSFAQEEGLTDSFVLLYSGNIGRFHELRTAIDAIGLLEERGRDDIEFVIIGEGARKADHQRYVEQQGLARGLWRRDRTNELVLVDDHGGVLVVIVLQLFPVVGFLVGLGLVLPAFHVLDRHPGVLSIVLDPVSDIGASDVVFENQLELGAVLISPHAVVQHPVVVDGDTSIVDDCAEGAFTIAT